MTDAADRQVEPRFKDGKPAPKRRAYNSTLAAASKPISKMSERQRGIESDYVDIKRQVHVRSGRRCEMPAGSVGAKNCAGVAREVHHVIERSLGRDDSLSNLRDLCLPCHRWCTENTVAAHALFEAHPLSLDEDTNQTGTNQ